VEFAIVLPLLVLLVFGVVEFGRAYNARIELTSAVREGARAAALGSSHPEDATTNAAPGLDPDEITVTIATACPANPGPSDNATVVATYPLRFQIPLFRSGTWTLTAKGVMRCGG
jgi:Flp pilus assembly protein TadG